MGILYVTEFQDLPTITLGHSGAMASQPAIAEQTVSYTTTTQSSAFNAKTRYVRLHTDSICSIEFGTNPSATTSTARMAANQTEYFAVPQGASYKVAAVSNT